MSYDVWLTDGKDSTESHNYTSNISPMIRLAWPGHRMTDLENKRGDQAASILTKIIANIAGDRDGDYKALNPPNGWGDHEGCVHWLMEIRRDCLEYPTWRVVVG